MIAKSHVDSLNPSQNLSLDCHTSRWNRHRLKPHDSRGLLRHLAQMRLQCQVRRKLFQLLRRDRAPMHLQPLGAVEDPQIGWDLIIHVRMVLYI